MSASSRRLGTSDDPLEGNEEASSSSTERRQQEILLSLEHRRERFRKFRTPPVRAPHVRRILLLSDLHMDYPANREWLRGLDAGNGKKNGSGANGRDGGGAGVGVEVEVDPTTMLIVAGDVSHDLDVLRWTLRTCKGKFGEVAFTIGNHELWLDRPKKSGARRKLATTLDSDDDLGPRWQSSGRGDGCADSLEKLEKVLQLCVEEGVRIGPVVIGPDLDGKDGDGEGRRPSSSSSPPLMVVPLLSWHHDVGFDTEPAIECWSGIPSARAVAVDYRRTAWPAPLSPLDDSAARFVDGLNDVMLDLDGIAEEGAAGSGVPPCALITFSHFLPRLELLPEKRYLTLPTLHSCVGSTFLEARLRGFGRAIVGGDDEDGDGDGGVSSLVRHLHAFGHTHLSWDATIDGVRYVQVPVAYPREWEQRSRSLEIGSMTREGGAVAGARAAANANAMNKPDVCNEAKDERYPVCIWNADYHAGSGGGGGSSGSAPSSSSTAVADVGPVAGFPPGWLGGWWSRYYSLVRRRPERNRSLAPWAARMYRRMEGGEVERFEHGRIDEQLRFYEKKNDAERRCH